ncbi:heme-binding protein [Streptomyces cucumeris]|uniref:heme-binding protein n=1 Tax=Streptomyces cucumeris TaxID=2962890 RepID=UPI003D704362
MAVGGGYPIIDNGKCVGGIGISGGSYEQDQHAAEEALAALGFEVPAHGPETSIIADSSFSVQSPAKLVNVDFHQVRGLPPDQHVRLLFSIPVVDELDGLKDSGTHQARWRATHTLGLLDNTLVGSTVGILDRRI